MLGQPIATLVNEAQPAGYHEVIWNGTNDAGQNVVSGIYLYKISTEKFTATRRMILLK
jgi:flagellar hook assembly protein FlgD